LKKEKGQLSNNEKIIEERVISGNVYDKFNTKNPIARYLVRRFVSSMSELVNSTGAMELHEVGCGEGNLSILWAKEGKTVNASDISHEIIQKAKDNAKRAGVDVHFKVADIYNLNIGRDLSEIIICCEVLEHLHKPEIALSVLSQIESPYYLFSVPREPIWRILNVARGKYLHDRGNTPGHFQHWTKKEFTSLLSDFFEIKDIRTPIPWTMVLCKKKIQPF
jgi:SAM-dependent methyltransferase